MFNVRFDTILAKKLFADLAKQLGPKETSRAIASAINRVSAMGKTAASRQIRGRYRIKKSLLDSRMGTTKAGARHLKGTIWSSGRPLPVRLFKYRQTKKGVKVSILGKQNVIPGAFVATMRNGHRGVFARGRYRSDGFEFRKKRLRREMKFLQSDKKADLPITALHTVSQGPMFASPGVIGPVMNRIEDYLPIRIEHELNRLLNKVGR